MDRVDDMDQITTRGTKFYTKNTKIASFVQAFVSFVVKGEN